MVYACVKGMTNLEMTHGTIGSPAMSLGSLPLVLFVVDVSSFFFFLGFDRGQPTSSGAHFIESRIRRPAQIRVHVTVCSAGKSANWVGSLLKFGKLTMSPPIICILTFER